MTEFKINIEDIELQARPEALTPSGETAERFDARMGFIGARLGAQKLGYNLTAIPPGKRAFPFHNHRVNEEMFFVLEGQGQARVGAETVPVRAGDILACPPGGPETAHQLINTGETELKFLAVSTRQSPEIAEYPDSGKFGVVAEFPPDGQGKPQGFRYVGRTENSLDYWGGE